VNGQRRKEFNLQTYKYHSLGDYADTICRFGTTDSFSTETVSHFHDLQEINADYMQSELEHHKPKGRFKHTDKKKLFVKQLAQIERRETRLRRIRARLSREGRIHSEVVARTPQEHHHIGVSQNYYEHVGGFLRKHAGNPAIRVWEIKDMVFIS